MTQEVIVLIQVLTIPKRLKRARQHQQQLFENYILGYLVENLELVSKFSKDFFWSQCLSGLYNLFTSVAS